MAPAASVFYSWDEGDGASQTITLDCLLPTGVIVPLRVEKDNTLSEIKEKLWKESQSYPLSLCLKGKNTYIFMCIDQRAEKVELWDEEKRLSEVKPFQPMLRVVDRPGNKEEKIMNSNISYLIGKGLHEFDRMRSSEVNDFRINMKKMAKDIASERDRKPWDEKVQHLYPPDVANSPDMPPHLRDKLINNNFLISVRMENTSTAYTIMAQAMSYPIEVIDQFLQKRANTGYSTHGTEEADKYILKISGKEEYLLGEYPLCQYQYLRKTVMKGGAPPVLLLVDKYNVLPPSVPARAPRGSIKNDKPSPSSKHSTRRPSQARGHSIWSPEARNKQFTIQIMKLTNVSYEDQTKLVLKAGLYHGSGNLCPLMSTHELPVEKGWIDWCEPLAFDISLENIPRATKLCFALYVVIDRQVDKQQKGKNNTTQKKAKQKKQELRPVGWVNIPVFDYKAMLHSGQNTLYLWPVENEDTLMEELVNPIGTVECNPDALVATALSFAFDDYGLDGPIFYPPFSQVLEVAAKHTNFKESDDVNITDPENLKRTISILQLPLEKEKHLEQLRLMIERDPLTPLHEQEIEMIWLLRYECQFHYPSSLPKLLNCVQWNNYIDVAQMQALLQIWPELPPTEALELLDFAYADKTVRRYAVQCLKNMSDGELCQYLLQLVQVLKYESHMECDLVEFLLRRALMNQRIGHYLFWLLRSEMHVPSVSVRFGLILEAYCHGNPNHMKILTKQVQALERLRNINMQLTDKQYKVLSPEVKARALQQMRSMINQVLYSDVLRNIHSTLDPSLRMGKFKSDISKFMDSKMRPLWCVWQNQDETGNDIYMMYKNGDDLRQDMLTLQIINIMDTIWQEEGLDLRLNAYGCLPTSHGEGVIEIVLNSNTLANIQKKFGTFKVTSGFNKESLLRWLKEHNKDSDNLKAAVEEFTLSCAGYCVATYVLGIGDRHSDNILLKENGQLFHIDFGHILGHFKTKFGVKRERVPFVLTTDFVHVIQQGDANQNPFPANDKDNFKRFGKICEVAYLALRKKANFLITLFMMMMNTGIPEISTIKDIKYLQDTLAPHLTEEEALKQFKQKFKEALQQSWKTSLNWSIHNMAKDNK